MAADPLLHAAVINNARWCDAVCRSHGFPGQFTGRLWTSVRHALPFFPNAITLSPDVTAAEATAGQDPSRPFAIKDSFARLDLAPHGLTPIVGYERGEDLAAARQAGFTVLGPLRICARISRSVAGPRRRRPAPG